jgi:hypothetical protein
VFVFVYYFFLMSDIPPFMLAYAHAVAAAAAEQGIGVTYTLKGRRTPPVEVAPVGVVAASPSVVASVAVPDGCLPCNLAVCCLFVCLCGVWFCVMFDLCDAWFVCLICLFIFYFLGGF